MARFGMTIITVRRVFCDCQPALGQGATPDVWRVAGRHETNGRAILFAPFYKFCFARVQDRPIMAEVMKNIALPIVIEADADGFFVSCPALQGCYSQGGTYEEAVENIKDAIKLHIEHRVADGEEIPQVSRQRGISLLFSNF